MPLGLALSVYLVKIVIQNGNNIGKHDLQRFADEIPAAWRKHFRTVVVYGSQEDSLKVTHHQKEGVLGIHCPISYKGSSFETLEEVAIHLAALNDIGHIPKKLSPSKRDYYAAQWRARTHT